MIQVLPDQVQGWFLLDKCGLDPLERSVIQGDLKSNFTLAGVENALRSHWTDEQIRRRDGEAKNQSFFHQDDEDADEDEPAGDLGESYFEGWSEQEVSWYQEAREQEHQAWIQFQQARRTLRDARARQAEVKASRRFFKPGKGSGKGKAPVGANPALGPCLKCGKNHRTADCPRGLSSETEKGMEAETWRSSPTSRSLRKCRPSSTTFSTRVTWPTP